MVKTSSQTFCTMEKSQTTIESFGHTERNPFQEWSIGSHDHAPDSDPIPFNHQQHQRQIWWVNQWRKSQPNTQSCQQHRGCCMQSLPRWCLAGSAVKTNKKKSFSICFQSTSLRNNFDNALQIITHSCSAWFQNHDMDQQDSLWMGSHWGQLLMANHAMQVIQSLRCIQQTLCNMKAKKP